MKRIIAILMLGFMLTACAEDINSVQNSDGIAAETTNSVITDEKDYIEGIFFSSGGSFPMILIDGTNPCYMKAADASVRFDGLTNGDRIRINSGVMLYTYPGQVSVTRVEKIADGDVTDICEAVIDELEKITQLTIDTSELTKKQDITIISNEAELDINSMYVPIQSKNIRCKSMPFDERYQMYFLTENGITLHIIDMYEGVIAHTEILHTEHCPIHANYGENGVTVFDFSVNGDNTTTVDCAYKISKSGDTFTVTPTETEVYPFRDSFFSSPDGKYTVFNITESGMGHGGIDAMTSDGEIQHVFRSVVFDAHVGGNIDDISDVAHYEAVGFISDTAFVYNIHGWEHRIGFGIYDFSTDESIYFKSGDFSAYGVYDGKIMVEERAPYYDATVTSGLWSVDINGNYTQLASNEEKLVNQTTYVLGENFYCYFNDGVWLNFKTNIDIVEADFKRIEILSADFSKVLAEIEYPYDEVVFYLDENLKATEKGVTVVFFDTK